MVVKSAVARLIMDRTVREAVHEVDLPHIVMCRDTATGVVSCHGPYDSGFAALVAADQLACEGGEEDLDMTFPVTPLFAPAP